MGEPVKRIGAHVDPRERQAIALERIADALEKILKPKPAEKKKDSK